MITATVTTTTTGSGSSTNTEIAIVLSVGAADFGLVRFPTADGTGASKGDRRWFRGVGFEPYNWMPASKYLVIAKSPTPLTKIDLLYEQGYTGTPPYRDGYDARWKTDYVTVTLSGDYPAAVAAFPSVAGTPTAVIAVPCSITMPHSGATFDHLLIFARHGGATQFCLVTLDAAGAGVVPHLVNPSTVSAPDLGVPWPPPVPVAWEKQSGDTTLALTRFPSDALEGTKLVQPTMLGLKENYVELYTIQYRHSLWNFASGPAISPEVQAEWYTADFSALISSTVYPYALAATVPAFPGATYDYQLYRSSQPLTQPARGARLVVSFRFTSGGGWTVASLSDSFRFSQREFTPMNGLWLLGPDLTSRTFWPGRCVP